MTLQVPRVVLLIEDEANIVTLIEQSLVGMNIDVVSAGSGEAGVQQAADLEPDLVLLDLSLPLMNGWDALVQIRRTSHGATVPVVLVTAHGDSETAVRAREAGVDALITKPFLPAELRRVVEQLIGGVAKSA